MLRSRPFAKHWKYPWGEASARYTKTKADPSFVRMIMEESQHISHETSSS